MKDSMNCALAKKIGVIWFCSLGCYGGLACRVAHGFRDCQWITPVKEKK